ncbi:MAG: carboxypeptidase-like regulatory domain-containing protein [Salibacteraceae bacterium]
MIGFVMLLTQSALSQELTNSIRGQVLEKVTQQPLPGATVIVLDTDPIIGASTDLDGYFSIDAVPIGRMSLQVSFLGYEPVVMQDLILTGSKALNLEVQMEESIEALAAVVITAEEDKRETINKMAVVSARTFSIEEAERFAGARADVARMASNYAGVRGANDATNDIVIRGNSSNGLLWRMNGVDIPNPNHCGDLGATGGPVSMLNSNVLRNSDFMTAAFPAEYGNATSGVFDLTMRNGNADEHEFLGQVGFNGFELGAEGPISRKNRSSYLVNARYSTLDAMQQLGMSVGTGEAVPEYQDITFNINVPTKKLGTFHVFGIAGNSAINLLGSETDTTSGDVLYGSDNLDIYDRNQMGMAGINHRITLGEKSYSSLTLAYTYFNAKETIDSVNVLSREACNCDWYLEGERNDKALAHWFISQKFNAKNNVKAGVIASHMMFDLNSRVLTAPDAYDTLSQADGSTQLLQPYAQWQWKPTSKLVLNTGVHAAYLTLNNSWSIEPRFGAQYNINPHHALTAGYGLHSRVQPMQLLFNEKQLANGEYAAVNDDLGFTKSHHAVVGHNWSLPANWRVKTEVYYQWLFDVPVSKINRDISFINFPAPPNGFDDVFEDYENAGEGQNYGVELTIEKFMTNGFYFLATTSIYRSQYLGEGNQWQSSAWDAGFVVNSLAGKEFELNKNKAGRKRQLFFTSDLKATYAGGQPTVPIDLEASNMEGEAVYDLSNGYSKQLKDYFRIDANIGLKMLGKRVTQEWFVITQNISNQQNPFFQRYDPLSQRIQTVNQLGLFIVPTYRITF